jgi:hypothetical protein
MTWPRSSEPRSWVCMARNYQSFKTHPNTCTGRTTLAIIPHPSSQARLPTNRMWSIGLSQIRSGCTMPKTKLHQLTTSRNSTSHNHSASFKLRTNPVTLLTGRKVKLAATPNSRKDSSQTLNGQTSNNSSCVLVKTSILGHLIKLLTMPNSGAKKTRNVRLKLKS